MEKMVTGNGARRSMSLMRIGNGKMMIMNGYGRKILIMSGHGRK